MYIPETSRYSLNRAVIKIWASVSQVPEIYERMNKNRLEDLTYLDLLAMDVNGKVAPKQKEYVTKLHEFAMREDTEQNLDTETVSADKECVQELLSLRAGKGQIFRKIKPEIRYAFEDTMPRSHDLWLLFEQEARGHPMPRTTVEWCLDAYARSVSNALVELDLYTDTAMYIWDQAIRKLAHHGYLEGLDGLDTAHDFKRYRYQDSDGTYCYLQNTMEQIMGNDYYPNKEKRLQEERKQKEEERSVQIRRRQDHYKSISEDPHYAAAIARSIAFYNGRRPV